MIWNGGRIGLLALVCWCDTALVSADATIEYVAHASFVVESPAGIRVVIDPFTSYFWLGYSYPTDVDADVVLVTHPHGDHDASYHFPEVPVLRSAGSYSFGDVRIVGIEGRHADPRGRERVKENTIWRIETGGVRIVHIGDNGPLEEPQIAALPHTDVLMIPIDSKEHLLKLDEVASIRAGLKPPITIPMHYRDELSGLPNALGPVEPWLEEQGDAVHRLGGHRMVLSPGDLEGHEVLVFQPHPGLELWPEAYRELMDNLRIMRQAHQKKHPAAIQTSIRLLESAIEAVPQSIFVRTMLGQSLRAAGRTEEEIPLLERSLAASGRDDWSNTAAARVTLAWLYREAGRDAEAAEQYRLVLRTSYGDPNARKVASEFLASFEEPSPKD